MKTHKPPAERQTMTARVRADADSGRTHADHEGANVVYGLIPVLEILRAGSKH